MASELVQYDGWQKVLRLKNARVEAFITTEVGPRIIHFGFLGGVNEFAEYADQIGKTGGADYRSYGGHRFWIAPEESTRTSHPDNNPVGWKEENGEATLVSPIEAGTHLQKQLRVKLDTDRDHVQIVHRVTNRGSEPTTLAPWAVTAMAPGGRAIIPQPDHIPNSDRVLPVRPLVLWEYTNMADPRWRWDTRFIQLRQDATLVTRQRCGTLVAQGWAAYANGDRVFLKRFPCDTNATYPDFGCNAEFFTNQHTLEIGSLGPLATLKPGESASHTEDWFLFKDVSLGLTDETIANSLAPLLLQVR